MPAQRHCDVCGAMFQRYIRHLHFTTVRPTKSFGVLIAHNQERFWLCKRCYDQAALVASTTTFGDKFMIEQYSIISIDEMVTTAQVAYSMMTLVREEREKGRAARVTNPARLVSIQG